MDESQMEESHMDESQCDSQWINCLVISQEPLLLCNEMDSYFKSVPPDCSLYSEENHEISIHQELLYQTPYMREIIMDIGLESKIEIFFPFLSKEELKNIVDFLYSGKILCKNQASISGTMENLNQLFGFELSKTEMSETRESIVLPIMNKHPQKKPLAKKVKPKSIKVEHDVVPNFIVPDNVEVGDIFCY